MTTNTVYSRNFPADIVDCEGSSEYSPGVPENKQNDGVRIKPENYHSGRWNRNEKKEYLNFIETHRGQLDSKQYRRSSKIFKLMSFEIKTRAADQCRSHHQKMQKKYLSVSKIIESYKNTLNSSQTIPQEEPADRAVETKQEKTSIELKTPTKQIQEIVLVDENNLSIFNFSSEESLLLNGTNDIDQVRLFRVDYDDPYEIKY